MSLKGLRVYLAEGDAAPGEVLPPPSPRKCWTRRGVAEWLVERLTEDVPTLVGIDHGLSLPRLNFQVQNARNPFRRRASAMAGFDPPRRRFLGTPIRFDQSVLSLTCDDYGLHPDGRFRCLFFSS